MVSPALLPSRQARISAGYTSTQAAKRLRVTSSHLLACERACDWPYDLARRAARVYGCELNLFLAKPGGGAGPKRSGRAKGRAATVVLRPGKGTPPTLFVRDLHEKAPSPLAR